MIKGSIVIVRTSLNTYYLHLYHGSASGFKKFTLFDFEKNTKDVLFSYGGVVSNSILSILGRSLPAQDWDMVSFAYNNCDIYYEEAKGAWRYNKITNKWVKL